MESKSVAIKRILAPQGFIKLHSTYFRYYKGETVQAVRLMRQRTMETSIGVGVFSIYDERLPEWFDTPEFTPTSYDVANYAGLRSKQAWPRGIETIMGYNSTPVFHREETDLFIPTDEENMDCLREIVIPRLNETDSQEKLVSLIHDLDTAEFGKDNWLRATRLYPALACGRYDEVYHVVAAIEAQHKNAEEKMKDHLSWEDFLAYCERGEKVLKPLIAIRSMLDQHDEEKIKAFLKEKREKHEEIWNKYSGPKNREAIKSGQHRMAVCGAADRADTDGQETASIRKNDKNFLI